MYITKFVTLKSIWEGEVAVAEGTFLCDHIKSIDYSKQVQFYFVLEENGTFWLHNHERYHL